MEINTKVKCIKCGFEDEGNFCSNCGDPLSESNYPVEQKYSKPSTEVSWLAKCPACKSGYLTQIKVKIFFGMMTANNIECSNCNALFTSHGKKYKFSKVQDESAVVWQNYGKQKLTDQEWKNIAYGGMSDAEQKAMDMEQWMTELKEGNLSINLPKHRDVAIITKKGEEVKLVLPDISLLEPRAVRVSTGTYGGPSFRVAKGVYFRVGGFRAQSESHEEIRTIDKGTLSLTNKRLVFSGSKRTSVVDLKKIVSIEPYSDGISIKRSNKQKIEYFIGKMDIIELTITIDDREYVEPFSGLMLKYFTEGLLKKME